MCFKSMKNSNDTIGNRTRAVPQPKASPRSPTKGIIRVISRDLLTEVRSHKDKHKGVV